MARKQRSAKINVKKALHKARTLGKRGDIAGAMALYRQVLDDYPENREAITALAQSQGGGSRPRGRGPAPPQEAINRAVALYQRGESQAALAAGRELAGNFPDDPLLQNFLGVVCDALGQTDAALAHYQRAIQQAPDYAEALCNRGICLQGAGRHEEAEQQFAAAVAIEPNNAQALLGLATALRASGRHAKAIKRYRECLALRPDDVTALNNIANCLSLTGQFDQAVIHLRRALTAGYDNADVHYNLANNFFELGSLQESETCYRKALELQPGLNDARAKLAHIHAQRCQWHGGVLDDPALPDLGLSGEYVSPFSMLAIDPRPATQQQRAAAYAKQRYGDIAEEPLALGARPHGGKLRLGYFSADFREHPVMHLMIKVLESHDPSAFEVHAFAFGPTPNDAMNARLRAAVHGYHDVRDMGDANIARYARELNIDIAIDLTGYTRSGRPGVFAFRAAPVQISYLGFSGTMALPAMDYILADPVLIPPQQANFYTESVIYLPHSFQPNDDSREIAPEPPSREDEGLPSSAFVFCCFNNSYKITSREFAIWMRLLQRVEGSVLWLKTASEDVRSNLRQEAMASGIAAERLIFAERSALPDHLARHALADLFLDTFNYNAHTTASDALWAGLPVLTRAGESFAARVGASLLTAAGLPELITDSDEAYEHMAEALAREPGRLAALRERLQAARSSCPLFDTAMFTRDLENAYRQVWERKLKGEPTASIQVAPSPQCK